MADMAGADLLPDASKRRYGEWEQLFSVPGWDRMTAMLQQEKDDLPDRTFTHAASFDELLAARAAVRKIDEILALPAAIELQKEQEIEALLEQQAEDKEANRPDV